MYRTIEDSLYLNKSLNKEGLVKLTWGNASVISEDGKFIAIKPSEILSTEYLLNQAQANIYEFKKRASGTTFAEISKQSFRPIKILLPDKKVMEVFSDLTKIIYKRIISSMKEIKNLVEIRDALLSKLISGELRITDAKKMIEKVKI